MRKRYVWIAAAVILLIAVLVFWFSGPRPGHVLDEASQARLSASQFSPIEHVDVSRDYFHDMDGGIGLDRNEINGRNMWLLWTGGNDRFWDVISPLSAGSLDFLKTVSSYDPTNDTTLDDRKRQDLKKRYKFSRDNRWFYLGLVNEPCFEKASGPDEGRFGLWLDKRRAGCPPDPFEDPVNYPGVQIGARGSKVQFAGREVSVPVGSYYGYATGIVGLRLFPNPEFNAEAARKWDPVRYYADESYYNSKVVKPYRVGMSCGFCHVGPNPLNSPVDPENPEWRNLSSTVGAQYFWIDRIFSWQAEPTSFVYQLFHTSRPGSLDTSLVSTDNINNPRTMNAVYNLLPRIQFAKTSGWGKEHLAGGGLDNRQFKDGPLAPFFDKSSATVWTPHVLKDGADSVGALGALNRVYLNIGLFSEEWLLHFRALVGGKRTTPIEIKVARQNSVYWQATEAQTPDMAAFLVKASAPHYLQQAPEHAKYLTETPDVVAVGKRVFADRCLRCHSSRVPKPAQESDPANCGGKDYLDCWNRYWNWTKTEAFKKEAQRIVVADDFLADNFLSTDVRVPVTLLQTNACSPLATNGIARNIWDNFTSQTYKDLPSVGTITYYHPVTGEKREFHMPGGGRGFTRPASLVSLWSTAPYLLNNSVGKFNPAPSVEARMQSFQDSIEQMLWPEKRDQDLFLGAKIPGRIDRTDSPSYLRVPAGYLPGLVLGVGSALFPSLFEKEGPNRGLSVGPFPPGMPVDLLANLELTLEDGGLGERLSHDRQLISALLKLNSALKASRGKTEEEARRVLFASEVFDPLFSMSKCPDYIVNRGHYFGTSYFSEEPALTGAEKNALIAFLKTF